MEPPPPQKTSQSRRIRVFVSSTFRDMVEDRDALMSHTWPELRRFCQERHVELVEVDLRWGIAEEQSTRRETLKLCLDEIRACRPYFIGLLGQRYGWVPGDEAFTADLKEEQSWLNDLSGTSVTELEILHGVLNRPDMAGRAFFYFRDPAYTLGRGPDVQSEDAHAAEKQTALKKRIRQTCAEKRIPLHENYPDPVALAALVLADLKTAIEAQFPLEDVPDALAREAQDHEAFAEMRRRTYIGRDDYFAALDRHAAGEGGPLVLLGESGGGKSALLANWVARWRRDHPGDFILLHHIGGTIDSADHWRLMSRVMAGIQRWSGDPEAPPTRHEDILRDFPLWLAKARARAAHTGVRFILVLDAFNQLADQDHARLLGWLPEHPFTGPLRLIVSTLPGKPGADDPLAVVRQRHWQELRVEPLSVDERRRLVADYLARFGKKLDAHRLERLATAPAAANPLYLKILLDELRVTGTHERLDERLAAYLAAADIPVLLRQVLARWQHDYERDRSGLVGEALGLIWAARRGLTENELLRLLKPADQPQLAPAIWNPLRAALEDGLIDRSGILNFAHDFLRTAVGMAFVPDLDTRDELQLRLADYFETEPVTARSCDELPWLLRSAEERDRLRACLLDIDRFLEIQTRDQDELMRLWVWLDECRTMGEPYLESFERWELQKNREGVADAVVANRLAFFLNAAACYGEAELLMRHALATLEEMHGPNDPSVASALSNLADLKQNTNFLNEAELLYQRALAVQEACFGTFHPDVARELNNLANLLHLADRLVEAEQLSRRSLEISKSYYGSDHPIVAIRMNNLATLLHETGRLDEAERLYRSALSIQEKKFGINHPNVAIDLNNLACLLKDKSNFSGAENLYRRALSIDEISFGDNHPNVARDLNNLAALLKVANRTEDAERLYRRAISIDESIFGADHPNVARDISNLGCLLGETGRPEEAENLIRRALAIDEISFGLDHVNVAIRLNNLANLLGVTGRPAEAVPFLRRALEIFAVKRGWAHPDTTMILDAYFGLLLYLGKSDIELENEKLEFSSRYGIPYRSFPSVRRTNSSIGYKVIVCFVWLLILGLSIWLPRVNEWFHLLTAPLFFICMLTLILFLRRIFR